MISLLIIVIKIKNKFRNTHRTRNKKNDEDSDKEDDNTIYTDDGSDSKNNKKKIILSINKLRRVITEKWHELVPEKEHISNCRMVNKINNNKFINFSTGSILITDEECDQTLTTKDWYILNHTGRKVTMVDAFTGRSVDHTFPLVTAIYKITDEKGNSYEGLAYESLYDDLKVQTESLLSCYQSFSLFQNGIYVGVPAILLIYELYS